MNRRWTVRAMAALGGWAAIVAVLYLSEADPRPGLLAVAAFAVAAGVWLAGDLGRLVEPAGWSPRLERSSHAQGHDMRVRAIERELRAHLQAGRQLRTVVPALVDVIEDTVADRHGVDRSQDPERFAELVGPDLAALVATPPEQVRLRAADLDRMLTKMESL